MRIFDCPVFVKAGNSVGEEIAYLEDALHFLYDWPHDTALRACRRAFEADYPLNAAREAFAGFAKSVGILDKTDRPPGWTLPRSGHGGDASK